MEQAGQAGTGPVEPRIVLGELHRIRQGRERKFLTKALAKPVPTPIRPVKAAVVLALAHRVQREIDAGTVKDRAEAARRFGISRARITQILDLAILAPSIQAAVLRAETVDGREVVTERALREVLKYDSWAIQQGVWASIADRSARAGHP